MSPNRCPHACPRPPTCLQMMELCGPNKQERLLWISPPPTWPPAQVGANSASSPNQPNTAQRKQHTGQGSAARAYLHSPCGGGPAPGPLQSPARLQVDAHRQLNLGANGRQLGALVKQNEHALAGTAATVAT